MNCLYGRSPETTAKVEPIRSSLRNTLNGRVRNTTRKRPRYCSNVRLLGVSSTRELNDGPDDGRSPNGRRASNPVRSYDSMLGCGLRLCCVETGMSAVASSIPRNFGISVVPSAENGRREPVQRTGTLAARSNLNDIRVRTPALVLSLPGCIRRFISAERTLFRITTFIGPVSLN